MRIHRPAYRNESDLFALLGFLKATPALDHLSPQAMVELAREGSYRVFPEGSVPFERTRASVVAVVVRGSIMAFDARNGHARLGASTFAEADEAKAAEAVEDAHSGALSRRNAGDWGRLVTTLHPHGIINATGLRHVTSAVGSSGAAESHSDDAVLLAQEETECLMWTLPQLRSIISRDTRTRHLSFSLDQTLAICRKSPAKRSKFERGYERLVGTAHTRVLQGANLPLTCPTWGAGTWRTCWRSSARSSWWAVRRCCGWCRPRCS